MLSTLEKLTGFLFVLTCGLLVALALIHNGLSTPTSFPYHVPALSHNVALVVMPIALLTLIAFGYLVYFYKNKCDQAELALEELNTALENSNERLDQLTNSDPTTETLNRLGLEKCLSLDLIKAHRSGIPLIAIVVDIMQFKLINERFGHEGDTAILKDVARKLKNSARRSDRVARVGEDKFLVILHDSTTDDAIAVKKRMAEAISSAPIVIKGSEIGTEVATGLSILPNDVTTVEQILALTKSSLQMSKGKGTALTSN